MKYIRRLLIDIKKLDTLKNIKVDMLDVSYQSIESFFKNDFNVFKEKENYIDLIDSYDYLKGVKNIEAFKTKIVSHVSDVIEKYVYANNINDEELSDKIRKYFLNGSGEEVLKYSEFIGKPMKGSEDFFFNPKMLKNEKIDYDSVYDSVDYSTKKYRSLKFLNSVLIPYYKKEYKDDYKNVIINKYEEYVKNLISSRHADVPDIFKMLLELYDIPFPKDIMIILLNTRKTATSYFTDILIPHIESVEEKGISNDEIYNWFVDKNGKYNFVYDLILKSKNANMAIRLTEFIKRKPPLEIEKIILRDSRTLKQYISLGYSSIDNEESFKAIIKSPTSTYKYVKENIGSRPTDKRLEDAILSGTSELVFDYFKNILKGQWQGNEDIKQIIENKINQSLPSILKYLDLMIRKNFTPRQKTPQNINNYLDQNYLGMKERILNSNIPAYLFDFVEITKSRLPQEIETFFLQYDNRVSQKYREMFQL
jgi:hypothetical protein